MFADKSQQKQENGLVISMGGRKTAKNIGSSRSLLFNLHL